MQKILVITGSTRPNRKSLTVAKWFLEQTKDHADDFDFELVDIADLNLPFMDEPLPPMAGKYQNEHTKKWAQRVGAADGYVLIVPEYNHSYTPVLKNTLDFLYAEWNRKPFAFVSYGVSNGVRAVEHLKNVIVQLDGVPLNAQVSFNVMSQFSEQGELRPDDYTKVQLAKLLDELKWWGEALKAGREKA